MANADPANAEQYFKAFDEQLTYIQRDYGTLKLDTKGFIASITDDGTPEIAEFTRFYQPGGERDRLVFAMQQALATPDPRKALDLELSGAGIT